jgi:uncharacterized protein DUF4920
MSITGKTSLRPALALCLLLVACRSKPPVAAQAPAPPREVKTYGQPLAAGETLPVSTLVAKPDGYAGKPVTVEGTVRSACTNRGCWLELAEAGKADAAGCRVTFKDYGFFVPVDSAGKTARVEGVVNVTELDEDTAKHYEGEGATVARGKDGKAREVQLVASGVELHAK